MLRASDIDWSPSPTLFLQGSPTTPTRRRLRFAPQDEILNPGEVATEPSDVDTVSDSDDISSASSEGPATPSPVRVKPFTDLKWGSSRLESQHDAMNVHSALNADASFIWDMTRSPHDFLQDFDDQPAAKWDIDGEPLSELTLALQGIYEWKIKVVPHGESAYPTVGDVFVSVYEAMAKPVAKDIADKVHPHTKAQLLTAWQSRCEEFSLNSKEEPLRRIDFLLGARRFLGVSTYPGMQTFSLNMGVLPARV